MFKKFTDTLSGTLDSVKSYGSSMVIGPAGQVGTANADGTAANSRPMASKISLSLPLLGNGSASAPATTANSPDRSFQKPSLASNTLAGIQNTLGKITGRGESTNADVMASHKSSQSGRIPTLGGATEVNETRITDYHNIDEDMKGLNAEDISSIEQYNKFKSLGQFGGNPDYSAVPTSERMNGNAPKLVRSNTDEIIDQQFQDMSRDLDNVLGETEQLDELDPVLANKDDKDEKKKPKKKKNKCFVRCIRCIQDNRVKGGCVDPEEMVDAAGDNLVLKKVLNIVFVVIGILLFAAVFVVIIYTSVVKKEDLGDTSGSGLTTPKNNDTIYPEVYDPMKADTPSDSKYGGEKLSPGELRRVEWIKASLDKMSLPEDDW